MSKIKVKPRKPHPAQGYEISEIYHNEKVLGHRVNCYGETAYSGTRMVQVFQGIGVNGPNVSDADPKSLRRLGHWLIRAADYLESIGRSNVKESRVTIASSNSYKE